MRSLLELSLGVLRADIDANKRYHVAEPPRLPCPITTIGWRQDVEVPHTTMGGWPVCGDTTEVLLDGEHYTFTGAPEPLRRVLATVLTRIDAVPAG